MQSNLNKINKVTLMKQTHQWKKVFNILTIRAN